MSNQPDLFDATKENIETQVMQEAPASDFLQDDHEDVHDAIASPDELAAFNR